VRTPDAASRLPDQPTAPTVSVLAAAPLAQTVQPVDYSYSNLDPRERSSRRYAASELAVLEELIAINGLTEASSASDFDDGDGVLEPLEFGTQVWCGGHLRELYSGPSEYASFGYGLRRLPETLGDLRYLTRLSLNSNRLEELPSSIGELRQLEVLELYDNQLRELPASIGGLRALRTLQLRANQLHALPPELGGLKQLTRLFTADNPLEPVPSELLQRVASTVAPAANVVRRNGDCSPQS
jgi:Leucine-rich repeat (LRR) protein